MISILALLMIGWQAKKPHFRTSVGIIFTLTTNLGGSNILPNMFTSVNAYVAYYYYGFHNPDAVGGA